MSAPSAPSPSEHGRPLRTAAVLAAVAAAALAAGCHRRDHGDRSLAVTTRLDCPQEQGDLRRTGATPDGRSCTYAGPDGQEVTLAYLALDGRTPQDALRPTELQLRAEVPAAAAPEPGSLRAAADGDRDDDGDDSASSSASAAAPAAPVPPGVPAAPRPPEAPQIDRSWTSGHATHLDGGAGERVRINLPFLHIDADGAGRAHVRTFGVDVNADDDGQAVVRTPGGVVDARDGGAEMRFGSVGRRRADLVYMVASDHPGPQGFRSGAYIARGPADGPLVLAVVRSRAASEGRHDEDLHDAKRLVRLNVRGARGGGFDFDID